MTTTLRELCKLLESCAIKLEEEIRNSIESVRRNMLINEFNDTKVALEKAKDYHNKEIITLLSGIITNIKQIVYHEGKIKQLNDKSKLTEEELKNYSYVKRQVNAFSGGETVKRREIRRTASETSVYYLDTWETFLKNEVTKSNLYASNSLPNINVVPMRKSSSKRKQKKLISSSFENILEDDDEPKTGRLDALQEENSEDPKINSLLSKSLPNIKDEITPKSVKVGIDIGEGQQLENVQENEGRESQNDKDEIKDCLGKAVREVPIIIRETDEDCLNYANEKIPVIKMESGQEVDTKPKIVGFVVSSTSNK